MSMEATEMPPRAAGASVDGAGVPRVGILILNYHEPEATLACVRRLLEVEGPEARVLWLENDAARTGEAAPALLAASGLSWRRLDPEGPLPGPGEVGYLAIAGNRGYAGGNNAGLRFLHRHGVPYTWVMNNDTVLDRGCSGDLVRAAVEEPGIGLWGMEVIPEREASASAWQILPRDFSTGVLTAAQLRTHPMAYVSGCAMFFRTNEAVALGGIPEEYFLYYEDAAFNWEFRRAGFGIACVEAVGVRHAGSMATGRNGGLSEYYCRRNRWRFIQVYFPEQLPAQLRCRFAYRLQKLLFRAQFRRIRLEWQAYRDFRAGRLGPTDRRF
jgi:hypothetical protein